MKENLIIGAGVIGFLFIIILVFYFIVKSSKSKGAAVAASVSKKKSSPTDLLNDLINAAREANSSASLNKIILAFIQTQSFGARDGLGLSDDAKKKLGFISVVCANQHADAKMIAFLNHELSKKFPSYRREFDLYENLGLAKRRMK